MLMNKIEGTKRKNNSEEYNFRLSNFIKYKYKNYWFAIIYFNFSLFIFKLNADSFLKELVQGFFWGTRLLYPWYWDGMYSILNLIFYFFTINFFSEDCSEFFYFLYFELKFEIRNHSNIYNIEFARFFIQYFVIILIQI